MTKQIRYIVDTWWISWIIWIDFPQIEGKTYQFYVEKSLTFSGEERSCCKCLVFLVLVSSSRKVFRWWTWCRFVTSRAKQVENVLISLVPSKWAEKNGSLSQKLNFSNLGLTERVRLLWTQLHRLSLPVVLIPPNSREAILIHSSSAAICAEYKQGS